jgi:CBS domain-containing protein
MSRNVVSVAEDTPLADVASLLESRGFKRVPVLRDRELVGIVSRADLVQALAARAAEVTVAGSDLAIHHRLLDELHRQPWWRDAASSIVVDDGVVHYWGLVYLEDEREAARAAAESVGGVRGVEDHRIAYRELPLWL